MDETGLNALERGVIERARRAGFTVECVEGSGPDGTSVRVVGHMGSGPRPAPGLVHFSLTRINGKSEVWVKYRYWPARKARLADVRAELDQLNGVTK